MTDQQMRMRALILNANIKKEQRSKTHMNMLMKIRMIKAKWIRLQEPNAYELKTCSRCKVEKYKWQFQKNRSKVDGLHCECGCCNNQRKKMSGSNETPPKSQKDF